MAIFFLQLLRISRKAKDAPTAQGGKFWPDSTTSPPQTQTSLHKHTDGTRPRFRTEAKSGANGFVILDIHGPQQFPTDQKALDAPTAQDTQC